MRAWFQKVYYICIVLRTKHVSNPKHFGLVCKYKHLRYNKHEIQ